MLKKVTWKRICSSREEIKVFEQPWKTGRQYSFSTQMTQRKCYTYYTDIPHRQQDADNSQVLTQVAMAF